MEPLELTPQEVDRRLKSGEVIAIIDVREPEEYNLARLESGQLMPMGTIPQELQKLESLADDQPLAIICHHGVRSLNVAVWLRGRGIENCFSVAGGIDRWSREVDPSVPRY
jgi:rhodanese-related sulfurtransferase